MAVERMRLLPKAKKVSKKDARPAGKPNECFYCKEKAGTYHKRYCVLVSCFPVTVLITDTKTGEQRTYHTEEYEPEDGWTSYMWAEGNYSCDCNRERHFKRAGEELDEQDRDQCCGFSRYRVDSITRDADGVILYSETEP